jgi:hypothetical protein
MISGRVIANVEYEDIITAAMIMAAPGYTGAGTYRFNVYVKSTDDIWNPYVY